MELSLQMKLRIAAAAAAGVGLIGFLAWPLAEPPEPFGAVSVLALHQSGAGLVGGMSFGGAITLAILAFLAGLLAYFLSWPYGREIGVLAVPAGLAVWAVRCGDMAGLTQLNPTLAQRQGLFAAIKWEPVFWLAIVAAGFAGVLLGRKISASPNPNNPEKKADSKSNIYLKAAIAVVGSGLIAQFCIGIFAQDIRVFDNKLGSLVAQPAVGQIVFAVLVSFGIAAFIVKKFLNASYIWPIIASAFVTVYVVTTYARQDVLQYLVKSWPTVFFPNAVISILPVQIVAFGTLGSIAGYWLAVRYNYWREHEAE